MENLSSIINLVLNKKANWTPNLLVHLILRVNHKRPAAALRHQDPILCRDRVARQTLCVPLANNICVTQNVDEAEARTYGNIQFLALFHPLVN